MSKLTFRTAVGDEISEMFRVAYRAFGMDPTDEVVASARILTEDDRCYGATDGGAWVASSSTFTFEITLPGAIPSAAAGLTMVGVEPTHRRRGILRSMIGWQHDEAARRGEPLSLLTASEASIYRRFGYGVVTDTSVQRIATTAVEFEPPLGEPAVHRMLDPHQDTAPIEAVYEHARVARPGWLRRNDKFWAHVRHDPVHERKGRTALRAVVRTDTSGAPDGYATWRVDPTEEARVARFRLHIEELVGLSPEAELDLWRFLANIDLVTDLEWRAPSASSALRWRLTEPRQLVISEVSDLVWARILDVSAVLSARRYTSPGHVTFEVIDRDRPDVGGTFHLVASGDGAGECRRANPTPSGTSPVVIDIADLASLALGAVSATELRAAGRVTIDDVTAERCDAVFACNPAPSCPIEF